MGTSCSAMGRKEPPKIKPVDQIDIEDFEFCNFFWEHVYGNKPLLIKGGVRHWPAIDKWSQEYFSQWAHHKIRVAPIPADGVNVRIEEAAHWDLPNVPGTPASTIVGEPAAEAVEDSDEEDCVVQEERGMVRKDRVAVFSSKRIEMAMGDFIDKCTNHVEGEPILYADGDLRGGGLKKDYPFVEEDILPLQDLLGNDDTGVRFRPKAQHMWLGSESTSKMHFDAVDNFFAQVVGTKRFILIEPKQTNRMVDGRLHKAYYNYDEETGEFNRDKERGVLGHEILSNYLPFDINNPDRNICPLFMHIQKHEAVVEPGDLFYQPYGWWHEVIGTPCPERKLCASISHFMQPYYGRSNEPKKRGLQWPIRRNPEYRSLTEGMIQNRLEIEAASCIQKTFRKKYSSVLHRLSQNTAAEAVPAAAEAVPAAAEAVPAAAPDPLDAAFEEQYSEAAAEVPKLSLPKLAAPLDASPAAEEMTPRTLAQSLSWTHMAAAAAAVAIGGMFVYKRMK